MTQPNFPIHEHFPEMWNAIVTEWISAGENDGYPHISGYARTLLTRLSAAGLMGSIVVFEADSTYTKNQIEHKLTGPIKTVLKAKLGIDATIAVTSSNTDSEPEAEAQAQADSQHEEGSGEGSDHGQGAKSEHDTHVAPSTPGRSSEPAETEATPAAEPEAFKSSEPEASQAITSPEPSAPAPAAPRSSFTDATTGTPPARDSQPTQEVLPSAPRGSVPELRQAAGGSGVGEAGGVDLTEAPSDQDFTFDNFVVGQSNNFAEAACKSVAEKPANSGYNPLFVWGESGLGKTHLLRAIVNYAKQLHPEMKVRFVTSEELTNEFINSIANDTREAFKRNYRNLDILIVDDVQFLQGKESTQEEFFHTFNTLHQARKQIVLSSDRPPRELKTLEDRLRTRLAGGLQVDVQTPDLETRIAILTKKSEADGITMPEDVKEFIAKRYEKSIRELEGARARVSSYCSIVGEPMTVEVAEGLLQDLSPNDQDVEITPNHVMDVVAEHYSLSIDELLSKSRARRVAEPRKIAMYLCRQLTGNSFPKLGEIFGGRDHTTVMSAEQKIKQAIATDKKRFDEVELLSKNIKTRARGRGIS